MRKRRKRNERKRKETKEKETKKKERKKKEERKGYLGASEILLPTRFRDVVSKPIFGSAKKGNEKKESARPGFQRILGKGISLLAQFRDYGTYYCKIEKKKKKERKRKKKTGN
jgi:hypothetical protein